MIVKNFAEVPKGVMCRPKFSQFYWMTKENWAWQPLKFIRWYRKWEIRPFRKCEIKAKAPAKKSDK